MTNNNGSTRAKAEMTLSVNIERNFGDVKVSYGLSGVYSISSLSELTEAYDELRTQVETQHELAQKNRPQLMPTQLKQALATNQRLVLCTSVRKFHDGKTVKIRLLGEEYSTHGIAVYPEYFDACGINPETLDFGEHPYNDYVLVQFDQAGNPKRAVTIVRQEEK